MVELSIYLSLSTPPAPHSFWFYLNRAVKVSLLVDPIGESLVGDGRVVHHLLSSGTREKGRDFQIYIYPRLALYSIKYVLPWNTRTGEVIDNTAIKFLGSLCERSKYLCHEIFKFISVSHLTFLKETRLFQSSQLQAREA